MQRWQAWARAGELSALFAELMLLHYDPHYGRSQARNFTHWETRQRVVAPDLSPEGIASVAQAVLALE